MACLADSLDELHRVAAVWRDLAPWLDEQDCVAAAPAAWAGVIHTGASWSRDGWADSAAAAAASTADPGAPSAAPVAPQGKQSPQRHGGLVPAPALVELEALRAQCATLTRRAPPRPTRI